MARIPSINSKSSPQFGQLLLHEQAILDILFAVDDKTGDLSQVYTLVRFAVLFDQRGLWSFPRPAVGNQRHLDVDVARIVQAARKRPDVQRLPVKEGIVQKTGRDVTAAVLECGLNPVPGDVDDASDSARKPCRGAETGVPTDWLRVCWDY